ncbi:MAG: hypothetical protein IJA41_03460 [Clostridia bacterium]|nr:hypothetical protein [Clostridia bacterium]
MNYLMLSAVVLFIPLQDVLKKPFTARFGGKGVYLFNAIISLVALIFFVVTSGGFKWNTAYLPYSVGYIFGIFEDKSVRGDVLYHRHLFSKAQRTPQNVEFLLYQQQSIAPRPSLGEML